MVDTPHESLTEEKMVEMGTWYAPLAKETKFSKYFSMVIFIMLPFIGFLLGVVYMQNHGVQQMIEITQENLEEMEEVVQDDKNSELPFELLCEEHDSCCESSYLTGTSDNNYLITDNATECAEGYAQNGLRCPTTLTWCEKVEEENLEYTTEEIFELMERAQRTGDYSICDKTDNYQLRCIAETELQETMKIEYNCSNSELCESPQCYSYMGCGGEGGGMGGEGCPVATYCVVNEIHVCTETGGTTNSEPDNYWGGIWMGECICPQGSSYIQNYGCAKCDDFTHEETRTYCEQLSIMGGGYFKYLE